VLIMTIFDDAATVQAAIAAGAHGYVLKDIGPDMLLKAVRTVAIGASFFHPSSIRADLSSPSKASDPEKLHGLGKLSRQEQRILPLLGEGRTNKEIGLVLALSENTIKNYLSNMFRKLKITRRTQAVTLYLRQQRRNLSNVVLSA
jgi:two-component system response regulator DevR